MVQLPDQNGKIHPLRAARFGENLDRERRYGTNEQIRSDRAQIIDQLNRLAIQANTTFNDLCLDRQTLPEQTPLEATRTPHANQPTFWNVPYPRNSLFTGREAVLDVIEAAAFSEMRQISTEGKKIRSRRMALLVLTGLLIMMLASGSSAWLLHQSPLP